MQTTPTLDASISGTSRANSSCLPSYRSSYLGRFHPYTQAKRTSRSRKEFDLMRTIDLRYEDNLRRPGGRYSLSLSVVLEEEDACTDACPDKSTVEEKLTILVGPPPSPPSKLRVIEAVMAFALAMRRRLLATKTA